VEHRNLYFSPNIYHWCDKIWKDIKAGHVARMGEMRNADKIFVGMPERKRPLGRPLA
jgi:hypothetical protein